jgi:SNF2 family DNA or RNA helicase
MIEIIKLRVGQFKYPVQTWKEGNEIFFQFGYNKPLLNEIKAMEGAKWHSYNDTNPRKVWSIPDSQRNRFQLDYLKGGNPYRVYDLPLLPYTPTRPLMQHQIAMVQHGLTRHYCIFAAEMRCGKTLSAIEVIENSGTQDVWYVAPKSALRAVDREFKKWGSRVFPQFMTYEALVKEMNNWPTGKKAPRIVIFDEITRAKNPTAQRSQACKILADGVRSDWGESGFVIGMSGSPAPKNPGDWWNICEIVCPGFLREGNRKKFEQRLGLIVNKESLSGGVYPHLVTWLDDENKCAICGEKAESLKHSPENVVFDVHEEYHKFIPAKNEVAALYGRLKGLVLVQLKKDCLDLPEKIFQTIECKPTPSILRAAKLIVKKASTTIAAQILLRELSDGFQYVETEQGTETCPRCNGKKTVLEYVVQNRQPGPGELAPDCLYEKQQIECNICGGIGEVKRFIRETKQIPCPKEDAVIDLLDEHEDIGRIVFYAGFTGSIDRLKVICQKQGWHVIRVDGRGWIFETETCLNLTDDPLTAFQDLKDKYPKIAFVAQAGSAGMGLDLTASPTFVYYSNDFDAEHRIQSQERGHGPGMDMERGVTIIDLLHLPTDVIVLENLKKKKRLQDLTLGQFSDALESYTERTEP